MAKYAVVVDGSSGADPQTLINVFSAGNARGHIYDFVIGSDATPADQASSFEIKRSTAVGTEGSGFTSTKLDPDTAASDCDGGVTHSVEPTLTANSELLQFAMNQRATFRWVAVPGGELVVPATLNNGIGLTRLAQTADYAMDACVHFFE